MSSGYEIFEPKLPLKKIKGCQNGNYQPDLLLINKQFYQTSIRKGLKMEDKEHVYEMPIYNPKETDFVDIFWESKPPFDYVLDYFA